MFDVWQSLCVLELFTVSFCACLQSECEAFNSLLIGSCGRLSQITCKLQSFFEFDDWFGFWMELVIGPQRRTPDMVVQGSGESGGH